MNPQTILFCVLRVHLHSRNFREFSPIIVDLSIVPCVLLNFCFSILLWFQLVSFHEFLLYIGPGTSLLIHFQGSRQWSKNAGCKKNETKRIQVSHCCYRIYNVSLTMWASSGLGMSDEGPIVTETLCLLYQQWWSFECVVSFFLHSTGLLLSRECLSHDINYFRMFRTNVRKYDVTWLEHSLESWKRYPDHSQRSLVYSISVVSITAPMSSSSSS